MFYFASILFAEKKKSLWGMNCVVKSLEHMEVAMQYFGDVQFITENVCPSNDP